MRNILSVREAGQPFRPKSRLRTQAWQRRISGELAARGVPIIRSARSPVRAGLSRRRRIGPQPGWRPTPSYWGSTGWLAGRR
jgi:hypothetical protein